MHKIVQTHSQAIFSDSSSMFYYHGAWAMSAMLSPLWNHCVCELQGSCLHHKSPRPQAVQADNWQSPSWQHENKLRASDIEPVSLEQQHYVNMCWSNLCCRDQCLIILNIFQTMPAASKMRPIKVEWTCLQNCCIFIHRPFALRELRHSLGISSSGLVSPLFWTTLVGKTYQIKLNLLKQYLRNSKYKYKHMICDITTL